jgi:hypothetical protein
METRGNIEQETFSVSVGFEQGGAGANVRFEDDKQSLVIHMERWAKEDGSEEWRNYGFSYVAKLEKTDARDAVSDERLQRLVADYPYWLSLARASAERGPLDMPMPNRSLKRGWKPSQPGRSPAFLREVADEFVRRFDAGENAVTAIASAHNVEPGTVSKWLTKAEDPRVDKRRQSRYRRVRSRSRRARQD